jgi:hypothetical protein
MKHMTTALPPKQEAFCQGIARGKSATQAYRDAGYSERGADASASRLLGNASIRARLTAIRRESEIAAGASRAEWAMHCWERFLANTKESPKYGEMLAKAMGWNEPERVEVNQGIDIIVTIGGKESGQCRLERTIEI